jgi:hypothetical protein
MYSSVEVGLLIKACSVHSLALGFGRSSLVCSILTKLIHDVFGVQVCRQRHTQLSVVSRPCLAQTRSGGDVSDVVVDDGGAVTEAVY